MTNLVLARKPSADTPTPRPRRTSFASAPGVPCYLQGHAVAVTQPTDATERHADSMADQVMSSASCPTCARGLPCTSCGERSDHAGAAAAQSASNPPLPDHGQSLDRDTRRFFEPRFGRDLSGVRVHASEQDGALASILRAAPSFYLAGDFTHFPAQFKRIADGTGAGKYAIDRRS